MDTVHGMCALYFSSAVAGNAVDERRWRKRKRKKKSVTCRSLTPLLVVV